MSVKQGETRLNDGRRKKDLKRCADVVRTSAILDHKSYLELYFVLAKWPVQSTSVSLHTLMEITSDLP